MKKNPYANINGLPIDGQAENYFKWAREKQEIRIAALPLKERKLAQAQLDKIRKKQNLD